ARLPAESAWQRPRQYWRTGKWPYLSRSLYVIAAVSRLSRGAVRVTLGLAAVLTGLGLWLLVFLAHQVKQQGQENAGPVVMSLILIAFAVWLVAQVRLALHTLVFEDRVERSKGEQ